MAPRPLLLRALVLGSALAVAATTTVAMAVSRDDRPGGGAGVLAAGRDVPGSAPPTAITADGRIRDLLRMGDRIYVRGAFRHIGPYSGSGMPLDPATGARITAPQLDGQISVSVPDGDGGWYVGGDFRTVGDVATRGLAHLDSAGVPDPDFTPKVNGLVSALALDGDTLWFGGLFDKVDGAPRRHLAAVSVSTGDLTAFSSPQSQRVTEMAYSAAGADRPARVYVGTNRLVALDPTTGAVDPTFTSAVDGIVRALLVDGDRIFVGGRGLAALDADGTVDPTFGVPEERFPADVEGTVHTLLLDGETLYVGGDFTSLGGSPGPLVALDAQSGLGDDAFAPDISQLTYASSDRGVFDLTSAAGHLWVGGSFARVAGEPVGNVVALDPASGARVDTETPVLDNGVNAVDASGDGLYVGGQFFMTDPVRAPGFVALDADTLLPVAEFDAARNGYGSMVAGDGVIYLGYTNFDGYSRYGGQGDWYYPTTDRIRAVDPITGGTLPDLDLRGIKNLSGFTAFGGELYVAERIENDLKFPHTRISVYSSATGERDRRFRLPLPGYVTELSSLDGRLLAAGSFRRHRENGQAAHLAAIEVSPRTGALNWAFDPHTHGPIGDVEVQDDKLFVSGLFSKVHTGLKFVERPGLAKYDTSADGFASMVRRFDPPAGLASRSINRLFGLDDTLFVQAYGSLFLDAATGAKLPDPTDGYGPVVDAAVADPAGPGSIVYAAHTYATLAGSSYFDLGFIARAGAGE